MVQKEVKMLSGHRADSKSPCMWGKCHPLILGLASSPLTEDSLVSAGLWACWTTFPSLPSHVDNVCTALWSISGSLLYSFPGQSPIFLFLLSVMGFQQSFCILLKECRAESYEARSLWASVKLHTSSGLLSPRLLHEKIKPYVNRPCWFLGLDAHNQI